MLITEMDRKAVHFCSAVKRNRREVRRFSHSFVVLLFKREHIFLPRNAHFVERPPSRSTFSFSLCAHAHKDYRLRRLRPRERRRARTFLPLAVAILLRKPYLAAPPFTLKFIACVYKIHYKHEFLILSMLICIFCSFFAEKNHFFKSFPVEAVENPVDTVQN